MAALATPIKATSRRPPTLRPAHLDDGATSPLGYLLRWSAERWGWSGRPQVLLNGVRCNAQQDRQPILILFQDSSSRGIAASVCAVWVLACSTSRSLVSPALNCTVAIRRLSS